MYFIKKEVFKLLIKSEHFSNLLTTINTNILRAPKPYIIRLLMSFCRLLVAFPKPFRTTQIVIKIIYTTLNSSIFLFF